MQHLIFVDPGVKLNGTYCCDVLLTQQLLPVTNEISGELFIFQQDSALAQQACKTSSLVERETPTFISPDMWLSTVEI